VDVRVREPEEGFSVNINELFPSRWIKSDDLASGDLTLTIREVTIEELGQDNEQMPVVWFMEDERGLPMNVTNARSIAELHGQETGLWAGKKITLFRQQVEFAGKQTWGVRIRLEAPSEDAGPPVEEGPAPQEPGVDEIPF
jgi:hypothetical protein